MWFIFLSFDKRMNNPVAHWSHVVSFCQWWNNCEWLLLIRTNKVIIFEGYKPPRHEITISNCSFSRCLWWCVNTSAYNIFLNCFINVLFLTLTATHYKSLQSLKGIFYWKIRSSPFSCNCCLCMVLSLALWWTLVPMIECLKFWPVLTGNSNLTLTFVQMWSQCGKLFRIYPVSL